MVGNWNSTWPNGTKSVKANRTTGQQNTSYVEANQKLDHYWNEDVNKDGHHKKVESTKLSSAATLSTGMDGNYHLIDKTEEESPDLQKPEPFILTNDGTNNQLIQLGFRVLVHFLGTGATPDQSDIKYSHNLNNQSASPKGVVRDGQGLYTLNFATDLPTNNYIVMGSAMRSSGSALNVGIASDPTKSNKIKKNSVQIAITSSDSGSLQDPVAAMIAIVGG